jgi:hypothetical protein
LFDPSENERVSKTEVTVFENLIADVTVLYHSHPLLFGSGILSAALIYRGGCSHHKTGIPSDGNHWGHLRRLPNSRGKENRFVRRVKNLSVLGQTAATLEATG